KLTYYGGPESGGDTDFCNTCPGGVKAYDYSFFGNSYRKYEPYESQEFTSAPMSGINTHVIRYADVLLLLAEAYIEKSAPDIAKGIGYINEVRNRPSVAAVPYPLTLSQPEARTALRRERQIELAGEQSRWFDLIRWGIAKETLNAEHPEGPGQFPFLDKTVLFPRPIDERNSKAALAADIANDWN